MEQSMSAFYYNANRAKLANPERAFSRSYLAPTELCLSYDKTEDNCFCAF